MKLFAIYIGGEHPEAHIEVHDIRFAVAPTITETHDQLRTDWWGKPGTLHIDCWAEIDHVEGYDIELKAEPFKGLERLYFVNLGGYDGQSFAEQHKNMFVVATSVAEAKARAMASISTWKDAHRDDFYEAEHAFALGGLIDSPLHIHLTKTGIARPPKFKCQYTPLK